MVRLVPRIELNMLTGFLGSGKTTLLRDFLRSQEPGSTAVIINEYGKVAIDDRLATLVDVQVSAISDGCVCCTVLTELRDALLDILARRARGELPALKRIVVETSGLADPAPIIATVLSDLNLNEYLSIGVCVAAFDPIDGLDYCARFVEPERQLVCADRAVVTKCDLVDGHAVSAAKAYLQEVNPLCEIITSGEGNSAAGLFAGPTRGVALKNAVPSAPAVPVAHTHGTHSFSLVVDEAVDWAAFSIWLTALLSRHGERFLRFKSMLAVTGSAGRLVIQGVRHKVYPPEHLPGAVGDSQRSELVFITRDLEEDEVRASLTSFLRYARVGHGAEGARLASAA